MNDVRRRLLAMIEADRPALIDLLSRLVQARSPNPPGDTREATAVVRGWLDARGAPYRIVAADATMPNILGRFDGARPGPHLVTSTRSPSSLPNVGPATRSAARSRTARCGAPAAAT